MVDRVVLTLRGRLAARWPLPAHPGPAGELLRRWSEPHRRYHDLRHLAECLRAGEQLRAGRAELLALWCHDAVHANAPGADEAASAELAGVLLDGLVPPPEIIEVRRLVLVTVEHRPEPGDRAGAVVSDADLWVLGAEPERYRESVADLYAESGLSPARWAEQRRARLETLLAAPVYRAAASADREAPARANLNAELAQLARPAADNPS